jgi:uncharacterized protein (TIGR02145 family)
MKSFLSLSLLALCLGFAACKTDTPDPQEPEPDGVPFTDSRDGKIYLSVEIGTQTWMAENLDYRAASCGDCYDSDCDTLGRIYTWQQASTCACPSGWKLPTDDDWKTLEVFLGMSAADADKKGSRGPDTGRKLRPGGGSGFRALMAGYRADGFYISRGSSTGYWSASVDPDASGSFYLGRELSASNNNIQRLGFKAQDAYSVRCIKK